MVEPIPSISQHCLHFGPLPGSTIAPSKQWPAPRQPSRSITTGVEYPAHRIARAAIGFLESFGVLQPCRLAPPAAVRYPPNAKNHEGTPGDGKRQISSAPTAEKKTMAIRLTPIASILR